MAPQPPFPEFCGERGENELLSDDDDDDVTEEQAPVAGFDDSTIIIILWMMAHGSHLWAHFKHFSLHNLTFFSAFIP